MNEVMVEIEVAPLSAPQTLAMALVQARDTRGYSDTFNTLALRLQGEHGYAERIARLAAGHALDTLVRAGMLKRWRDERGWRLAAEESDRIEVQPAPRASQRESQRHPLVRHKALPFDYDEMEREIEHEFPLELDEVG